MLNTTKQQKGFTIIEVLIVLAIGGLIMLIVFLAVPALQRNSRNTQRNADVTAVGGALSEYVNNNGGVLPADNTAFHANVKPNFKVGFYDGTTTTNIVYAKQAAATVPANPASIDNMYIYSNAKCASATLAGTTGANSRSLIAYYLIETGSGTTVQCKEL